MTKPEDHKAFRYLQHTDLHVGRGLFRNLPAFIRERGFRQPAFLVDEGFSGTSLCRETIESLRAAFDGGVYVCTSRGNLEPTYDYLGELTKLFRGVDFDVLVAVGGGSCMDAGKTLAALKTNPGEPIEYRGFDKLKNPGIPAICIPTTAGTGSEVSYNASFVDSVGKRKMGINGNHMFATFGILDPETTLSCPYRAAMGAGVDALVHTLEGFVCKQQTPVTRMLAKEAFGLLVRALPALKLDPGNLERRQELLLAASYGGLIQMNSGSGVAAAISYPLSVYYQVPHGIGGGMFLLKVMQYNIAGGYLDYSALAPLAGVGTQTGSEEENSLALLEHLGRLWQLLEVPTTLQTFGIARDSLPRVLEVMKTQQPGFDQNPLPFTVEAHLPPLLADFF
jgi:alcohol dehydrogenase